MITTDRQPDLQVVHDEPAVRVAFRGLPPIYAHGLRAAVVAAGMALVSLASPDGRQPASGGRGPTVVVLGMGHTHDVPAPGPSTVDEVPALVHVIAAMSTESCAGALRDGAIGVVAAGSELIQAVAVIAAAARGHTLLPRPVAQAMCRTLPGAAPELLTHEREWLRQLADARTVATLARMAGYSEREMYRRLNGIYARLGAGNRTEALLLAQRHGLLEDA